MAQFDDVFNPNGISGMLFFNVKPVLKYPTLEELESNNPDLAKRWLELAKNRYNEKYSEDIKATTVYENHAVYYAEFSRIVAITYATVYMEDGSLKRYMKKIVNEDEYIVLATFFDELNQLSSDGVQSTPNFFPILCGHNIQNFDIPLLVKKHIEYRSKLNCKIPLILKRTLSIKPWESGIIDTVDVWKFNGYGNMPLMLIADYIGLKKTTDILPLEDLSRKYWEAVESDTDKAVEAVAFQSATQTNLVIQLMNIMRNL